jgi:hypothetical protein
MTSSPAGTGSNQGQVPPRVSLPLHPAAKLSDSANAILKTYFPRNAQTTTKTVSAEASGARHPTDATP